LPISCVSPSPLLSPASPGLLAPATDGVLGLALLAPFDARRIFFPFRPIAVSPLGIAAFLSARGAAILASELVWVWAPCALLAGGLLLWRRRSSSPSCGGSRARRSRADRPPPRGALPLC